MLLYQEKTRLSREKLFCIVVASTVTKTALPRRPINKHLFQHKAAVTKCLLWKNVWWRLHLCPPETLDLCDLDFLARWTVLKKSTRCG